ncbi:MAG: hypothetical protein J6D08_13355 [Lachnospiraceae bacterium]|nr:hypothetical protein [Lachnospiraceae bacterium]
MRKKIGLLVLCVMLMAGCGNGAAMTDTSHKEAVDSLAEARAGQQISDNADEQPADKNNGQMPRNERIKGDIYRWYNKAEDSGISEEEILDVKGKLYAGSLTIHSGEELLLFRAWYDWDTVWESTVIFSENLEEWSTEELKELSCLTGSVHIDSISDGGRIAAKALTYLTGAEALCFGDATDVVGTLQLFPQNVKSLTILSYQPGNYTRLFKILQGSQLQELAVYEDYRTRAEGPKCFWLDDAVGIESLEELYLYDSCIRVRDRALLKKSNLKVLQGYVDEETKLSFVKLLPKLEKLHCTIMEEMDLSFLTQREDLELTLHFCQSAAASGDEAYIKEK